METPLLEAVLPCAARTGPLLNFLLPPAHAPPRVNDAPLRDMLLKQETCSWSHTAALLSLEYHSPTGRLKERGWAQGLRIVFGGIFACTDRPGLKPQGYGTAPVETG